MEALEVSCAACGAGLGETCTTIMGDVRTPHAPRVQLAAHPDTCGSCGAGYGKPCRKVSGTISLYPHRARLRPTHTGKDIAWTT